MGFNLGAFAAGAIKGAGDLMEEQHKETKDSIDKNMKFAYEQGLPFHRARKDKLRKFKGYAADLQNMQLSADQVSVVMGKSEKFITEFIANSQREKQDVPTFDIASQVTMKDGGTITPWENVQMGTIDLPSIEQVEAPKRKSLFSTMTGAPSTSSGFDRMKNKTQTEMEGITGASYNDVSAAAGQYYNYEVGSEGTVNMINSSASRAYGDADIRSNELAELSPIRIEGALFQLANAKVGAERDDQRYIVEEMANKIKLRADTAWFDSNIDADILQDKLSTIKKNILTRNFGVTPEQGLYAIESAILQEKLVDSPDPEKIEMLEKNRMSVLILLGDQESRARDVNQTLTYGHWNTAYDSRVLEILSANVQSDDPAWVYDEVTRVKSFDWSRSNSKAYEDAAKAQTAFEFTQNVRRQHKDGLVPNNYLTQFMYNKFQLDPSIISLPIHPTKVADVDKDAVYAVPVQISRPEGWPVNLKTPMEMVKKDGAWVKRALQKKIDDKAQGVANAAADTLQRTETQTALMAGEANRMQQSQVPAYDVAASVAEEASFGSTGANKVQAKRQAAVTATENALSLDDNEQADMQNLYLATKRAVMSSNIVMPENELMEHLDNLMRSGNPNHIYWAQLQLNELE